MASKWSILFFIATVAAATFYSSAAQNIHVVGDAVRWILPPVGAVVYSTWASGQTFTVGDILVFNFTTGFHDVAEVSSVEYDGCTSQSPITISKTGPTNITLTSAGEHFYICTFTKHCDLGMKLAINVSNAASTTPTPTPQPTPAQSIHVVGDALRWVIPPGGAVVYSIWASGQTFIVGDILVFNFTTGFHDVAEVSSTDYNACTSQSPITISKTGPTNITLTSAGEHFYICTYTGHCGLGMKLAINVSNAASTTPTPHPTPSSHAPAPAPAPTPVSHSLPASPTPSPTPSPASASVPAPAPSPARTPTKYVVGDALGWTVPPAGPINAYQTWASNKTFFVGDTLVFNFPNGVHDVAQLTSEADYDSCNTSSNLTPITTAPASITLKTPGENFFICNIPSHCSLGQKLAVNVTGTTPAARPPSGSNVAPSSPTTPDVSSPPSPNSAPNVVVAALPITLLSIVFAFIY